MASAERAPLNWARRPVALSASTSKPRSPRRPRIRPEVFWEPTSKQWSRPRSPASRKPAVSANSLGFVQRYEMSEWTGTCQSRIPRATVRFAPLVRDFPDRRRVDVILGGPPPFSVHPTVRRAPHTTSARRACRAGGCRAWGNRLSKPGRASPRERPRRSAPSADAAWSAAPATGSRTPHRRSRPDAAIAPAIRAARVDPMIALREP